MAKTVFFVGAGISYDAPSNHPLAATITYELLTRIGPDESARDLLLHLADQQRPNKRFPGDYIRFEQLVEAIQTWADPSLDLMRMFALSEAPNRLHGYLARRAVAGDLIVTTNFDCLLEEAVIGLGHKVWTVVTQEDFRSYPVCPERGLVPVVKLHGTYWRYCGDRDSRSRSVETIQATLAAITAGGPGLALAEPKRSVFIEALKGATLIIAGYSGSDDLDIIPTMSMIEPGSLTWIEHSDVDPSPADLSQRLANVAAMPESSSLSARDTLLSARLRADPRNVHLVVGNTYRILSADNSNATIHHGVGERSGAANGGFVEFVGHWEQSHLGAPGTRENIAAELLQGRGRFTEAATLAKAATLKADSSTDPQRACRAAVQRVHLHSHLGEHPDAERWSSIAIAIASRISEPQLTGQALNARANVLRTSFRPQEALSAYDRAISHCRTWALQEILSAALHDSAVVLQDSAQYSKALPRYRESIALSENVGDFRHVAWTYHQLGTLFFDTGHFLWARAMFKRALERARLIGDFGEAGNAEHELAMVAFHAGSLPEAMRRFRRSLRIDREIGRRDYLFISRQHFGVVLLEAGRLPQAEAHLTAAWNGYVDIGDEFDGAEVLGYLALLRLKQGRRDEATYFAQTAQRLAAGAPSHLLRASCLEILSQPRIDTLALLEIFQRARRLRAMAVLADLVTYCAELLAPLPAVSDVFSVLDWTQRTYKGLGNRRRYEQVCSYAYLLGSRSLGGEPPNAASRK